MDSGINLRFLGIKKQSDMDMKLFVPQMSIHADPCMVDQRRSLICHLPEILQHAYSYLWLMTSCAGVLRKQTMYERIPELNLWQDRNILPNLWWLYGEVRINSVKRR